MSAPARLFRVRYALHSGGIGVLHVLCSCSVDAVLLVAEAYGDDLRRVSARPIVPPTRSLR